MKLTTLNTMSERIELLKKTVEPFKVRAQVHDENGTFPHENFEDLKAVDYPALTVPKQFGGMEISLTEMLQHQEVIAQADGSTALSIGWHMGIVKHLGENERWPEGRYATVARDVVKHGALLNNAASEPATGSPTRGGKPETFATKTTGGWIVNGRKTFTTLSPILDYFIVSASIDSEDQVGNFLIKRDKQGVRVDETWDSIAMRGSGSHDLVLENVHVDADDLVERIKPGRKKPAGWLLHIPACYLGIARAAQAYAVQFATTYSPNSITGTIADLPNIKQKLGEMELAVLESEHFLYSVARKWDENGDTIRQTMGPELGAVKLSVVNKAIHIVDLAMRVVGARSLSKQNPLQRYYRDVRAGLHNPPMDDMTIMQLSGR
ncbi:acyl-CoA dehydrogenase family protein [Oceanobacillus profundus]|uniref:acyl-CoA dehydrogenase family protein n=1 Tax=Oceanobacillus TaxID=182709 RepID=UPI0026E290BC|nr:acyl-CoA dehydrogenase family protein [Oceanobacillus profundus]MBR3118883.1 acyl-CoA/acyl-ACP dehydrogenase [Oceanobacillus sp.]MDO6451664.1 acyl-CoA dehydrogenase family protein [Oceanobacillus profundus]